MAMTENSLRQPMRFVVDLSAGLVQQPIRPQLMKGDKQANAIIVKVTNGSESVDLTGVEVAGSFISPVESAELPLPGEAVGDEAHVTLLDQCYAEDGFFECSVKLKLGGTERTILSITGNVLSKGSGAYIDVGDVIPSIDDIIAQYAEMKRVTEDVQAAAGSASTAAGNANTAAGKANAAAAKIDNMTVNAVSGTSAGAAISEKNGAMHIDFTLPKGEKGDKGDKGDPGQNGTGSGTVTGIKVDDQTYQPDDTGVVELPKMGGGAEVDDTLTQKGKAADAKKTGDALNQLSQQIKDLDAEDVGALPKGGTAADASKLGGVTADKYALKTDIPENTGGADPLDKFEIGVIYHFAIDVNPPEKYGGEWEKINGRILIGTGTPEANSDGTSPGSYDYGLNIKGGTATKKIGVNHLPEHTHPIKVTGIPLCWAAGYDTGSAFGVKVDESGTNAIGATYNTTTNTPLDIMPPFEAVNIWKRVG